MFWYSKYETTAKPNFSLIVLNSFSTNVGKLLNIWVGIGGLCKIALAEEGQVMMIWSGKVGLS